MLRYEKVRSEALAPTKQTVGSAGYDISACINEPIAIKPGERHPVPTGIRVSCPDAYALQVWPRSGLALRHGIDTLAGLIDSDYRGEVICILVNHGNEPFSINHGDRIAQLVPVALGCPQQLAFMESSLSDTTRGQGGFGSTGV
jgi:dUTP pyrophosphatase